MAYRCIIEQLQRVENWVNSGTLEILENFIVTRAEHRARRRGGVLLGVLLGIVPEICVKPPSDLPATRWVSPDASPRNMRGEG